MFLVSLKSAKESVKEGFTHEKCLKNLEKTTNLMLLKRLPCELLQILAAVSTKLKKKKKKKNRTITVAYPLIWFGTEVIGKTM